MHDDADANIAARNTAAAPPAFDDLEKFGIQISPVIVPIKADAVDDVGAGFFPVQHTAA
jgi:hypothetical protein